MEAGAGAVTISTILTSIGSVVTACIDQVGDWMAVVTGNPIILLFVLLPLVGIGVGFVKRLINF